MEALFPRDEYRNVDGRSQRKFYVYSGGKWSEEWRGDWCLLAYRRGESDA
jgi:hypothetical protein